MFQKLFPPCVVDDRGGYPHIYTAYALAFVIIFSILSATFE